MSDILRWPQLCQAYDDSGGAQGGNNFTWLHEVPGYNLCTEAMRAEDIGENGPNGHTVLAFNWYFRRDSQDANYHNIDNIIWTFRVAASPGFNLFGGKVCPFVVVADHVPDLYPNGNHQPPSSGRYWRRTHPLQVGTLPLFEQTTYSAGNDGWTGTFSRVGPLSNMPPNPDLRCIECFGIGFIDYTQPPTGDFAVQLVQLGS